MQWTSTAASTRRRSLLGASQGVPGRWGRSWEGNEVLQVLASASCLHCCFSQSSRACASVQLHPWHDAIGIFHGVVLR